jgi:hypothetical protein
LVPKVSERAVGARLAVLSGVAAAVVATLVYSYEQASMAVATQGELTRPVLIGAAYLAVMSAAIVAVVIGLRRIISVRAAEVRLQGFAPTSPGWLLPYVLSVRRYRRSFLAASILYGAFYAVITSMIVYQPNVNFAAVYGVSVPSASLTPRGAPLFAPDLILYLPGHVAFQLIPLTVILLLTISALVGINLALSVFAFDNRAGAGRGLEGALGAVVGLFTGCPTCAGLFFANALGGSGAVSLATLLGYYQPAFILVSIPILLATPFLTTRSLAAVFREGCVRIRERVAS